MTEAEPNQQDLNFLKRCTVGLSKDSKRLLWEKYQETWIEAAEKEPVTHKKENAGRLAANTYIRFIT